MISEKTQEIIKDIERGKSLSEIARENGVSRQRVHQVKTNIGKYKARTPKEKKPTKKELKAQLVAEAREKAKLQAEVDALKQKEWKEQLSLAFTKVKEVLSKAFGGTVHLLRFEHVDEAGYWFTFELTNNSTRQTYRVGHNEI
jgi:predicted DNA-binding protein YlxM (UPF0122 family)